MAPILLILCLSVVSATAASNDNCANKENCNAEDGHLLAIYCKDGQDCTCLPGSDQYNCDGLTLPTTLTGEECKEFCKNNPVPTPDVNTTEQCVFYKFEQVAGGLSRLKLCATELFSVRSTYR